jgi:hypothetical protein
LEHAHRDMQVTDVDTERSEIARRRASVTDISDLTIIGQPYDTPTSLRSGRDILCRRDRAVLTEWAGRGRISGAFVDEPHAPRRGRLKNGNPPGDVSKAAVWS